MHTVASGWIFINMESQILQLVLLVAKRRKKKLSLIPSQHTILSSLIQPKVLRVLPIIQTILYK